MTTIKPLKIHVPQEALDDLRERLARTRWPAAMPEGGWNRGVDLAYRKDLVAYWLDEYDWREQEAQLNRLNHFKANVDGLGIHFIRQEGKGPNPLPLFMMHGYPWSFVMMLKILPLLTDPASHGGDPADAFNLQFLDWGLHTEPDRLRQEVQKAIDATGAGYDAILLGYGLCSNGLQGIAARGTRLVIVKGHDCITLFLGSRGRYRKYFDEHPGTCWYTPGWIENHLGPGRERYETTYRQYLDTYGEDNAQYPMAMEQDWLRKSTTAAYIECGVGNTAEYESYARALFGIDAEPGQSALQMRKRFGFKRVADTLRQGSSSSVSRFADLICDCGSVSTRRRT